MPWNETPDPNDFFVEVENWDWNQRFDVSAYLNARDKWIKKLREATVNALNGCWKRAEESREETQRCKDTLRAHGLLIDITGTYRGSAPTTSEEEKGC